VRDYGLGIPGCEQKQIFRKFIRGAAAKSHGIEGTGIGLAMVRHIVQAHGGSIAVASAPGKGSTFIIALPTRGTFNGTDLGR
jgi:signal transduction histidine kinase